MSALVPFIEIHRGGTLECMHFGALAVADARSRLVASAGDPFWVSYTRSTLKPLQALALLRGGGAERFGFGLPEVALLCASHSGEPLHVAHVQQMLDRIGLERVQLQCGCHVPLYVETVGPRTDAEMPFDERHNNCSGKHTGFLAWCVQHGHPVANYLAPAHPVQRAVRTDVARVMGIPSSELRMGVDGCSAPNYAVPLVRLAAGFARLATGSADAEYGPAFDLIGDAMTRHPELVSGTGRGDLALAQAGRGDWIVKGGADGMQVVASRSRGQALALKVIDGNRTAVQASTIAALDQLGWLDMRQREELRPWRFEPIANARGTQVALRKAVLRLQPGVTG